jgi:putative transposase
MIKTIKIRLKPTEEQEKLFWQASGTARFIYNWALNRQIENYKNGGKFISDNDLRKEITQLKKSELTWLNEISNNIPKQAVKDLCNAYKRFFTKKAKQPKFKKKSKCRPSFYNDCAKLKVKKDKVLIEKIGWIELAEPERIPTNIKYSNPRITHDNKYWYIAVGIEVEPEYQELTDKTIGIDLGIKDLAIINTGGKHKNINKTSIVKKIKKKLKRLQRKVSRKYEKNKTKMKGGEVRYNKTKNIMKTEKKIKLIYRRLTNIRLNNIHQITTSLVKTKPQNIVIEDLNISGMMKNRHLSKAIQEQCLYTFTNILEYKTKFYGINLVKASRWYPSSKTCSKCGNVKKDLKLSDRMYKCECGFSIDRDLNAAINLSKLA